MNNNFKLIFLSVLVTLFLIFSFYVQAESVGGGRVGVEESRLKDYTNPLKDEYSKLKGKVVDLNKTKAKLEITILKKQAAIDMVQDKLTKVSFLKSNLKKQLESLEDKHSRLESEFITYRRENKQAEKDNDCSKANLKALKKAKDNFEKILSEKKDMIRKLESRLNEANLQKNNFKNQIKALESKRERLKGDISASGNDYTQARTKITYLNGELVSLAEDKAGVEVMLSKKEAVIRQLKSELSEANSQEGDLRNQISILKNKHSRLKGGISVSDKDYAQAKTKITYLNVELMALTKDKEEVEVILLKKDSEVQALKSKLDKDDSEKVVLKRQISILTGERSKLKNELVGLNKQYLAEKSLIENLGDKLNQSEIKNNKIERQIRTIEKEHSELNNKFIKLNGENKLVIEESKLLKVELEDSNKTRARVIADLDSSKVLTERLQYQLDRIDSGGAAFKAQVAMLKDEKNILTNNLAGVNKSYKLAQERITILEKDLKKWANDKIDLKFILSNKEILADGLQAKLERSIFESRAFEKQIFKLNEDRKEIEQENRILNKDLEVLEETNSIRKAELDKSEALVREMQDKLTQIVLERDNFKKETKSTKKEFKILSNDLKLAKDLNTSFRATFSKEKAKARKLEAKLTQVSPEKKELNRRIKDLEGQRIKLENKLEVSEKNYKLVKNEIADLKKSLGRAGKASHDEDSFSKGNKILELETKLSEIKLDKNSLKKRINDAGKDSLEGISEPSFMFWVK